MTTLTEDCEELSRLNDEAKDLDKRAKEAKALAKEAEARLLERMQQERCRGHATDTTLYTPTTTNYAVVQDEAAFLAWVATYDEDLTEVKPKSGLLNELVRERLDNGEPLPPGVGFYPKEYISKKAR